MERHITHNISSISSEAQYPQNKRDTISSSSSSLSEQKYFEKNKSEIEWSKIIANNNTISNRIINEEEINITNKSFEEKPKEKNNNDKLMDKQNKNKGKNSKSKSKSKEKYNLNNKLKNKNKRSKNKNIKQKYSGDKYKILDNGIILKNLNNFKKDPKSESPSQFNYFYITNKNKNNNKDNRLKFINDNNRNNDKIILPKFINQNNNNNLNLLLKSGENEKLDTFHIMYIKRPNRAFFTKICKYKNNKIKSKEYKKINNSSIAQTSIGIYSKNLPNSSRLTPVTTLIEPHRLKEKSKTLVRNKYPPIIDDNNNFDKNLVSLSTNSIKKLSANSNASMNFSKSNNIINNHLKKRPLSSINIDRKGKIDQKAFKNESTNINTYNKSHNIPKTKFITSVLNTKSSKIETEKNIIYENINFKNQFKELKNAFEIYDYNTNSNYIPSLNAYENKDNNFKFNTVREYQSNINIINKDTNNKKKEIMKNRKLNSAKVKNTSYHLFYPKEISPLYDCKYSKKFEDEKQNKPSTICRKCGYQKHFGNEKNCPICITKKEQNNLREEKLSNKHYYFPFKDKYDYNYSMQNSFRRHNHSYNTMNTEKLSSNIHNHCKFISVRKENGFGSFYNPFNLNNVISSPNIIKKRITKKENNYIEMIKSRSNIYDKYDVVEKYFE